MLEGIETSMEEVSLNLQEKVLFPKDQENMRHKIVKKNIYRSPTSTSTDLFFEDMIIVIN